MYTAREIFDYLACITVREGEIKGINDYRFWENGHMSVILSGINVIFERESISRSHMGARSNLPDDVEVLEEKGPTSLAMGEFARVLQIGQVLWSVRTETGWEVPCKYCFHSARAGMTARSSWS